ncbi:MAG: ankyrin repeat domain-containing protein [Rubripirellula sp.]
MIWRKVGSTEGVEAGTLCCHLPLHSCEQWPLRSQVTTPLGRTAWYDAERIAQVLIDLGADLQATCFSWSNTPLGWACYWGNPKVAKVLIEAGCDTNGYAERAQNNRWSRKPPSDFDAITAMVKRYETRKQVTDKP